MFVCLDFIQVFLQIYIFVDSQVVYLCASIQLMEMVLIHILFLQHLRRLCKIHSTAV